MSVAEVEQRRALIAQIVATFIMTSSDQDRSNRPHKVPVKIVQMIDIILWLKEHGLQWTDVSMYSDGAEIKLCFESAELAALFALRFTGT